MYRSRPADGCVWITGASSGIGRGVALELAKRGYTVIASARRADELNAVCEEAKGLSGRIFAEPCDITHRDEIQTLVERITQNHGPIALAFLNAGTFFKDRPGEFGGDGFRKTFVLNVDGSINCLGPVINAMAAQGRGQIAVNASLAGYGGMPRSIAYSASKAALIVMCEALKFDLDKRGLTLQIVNPGFVKTPLTDNNDFPMPFLIELDDAARRICDGFETAGFEICFPRPLVWPLKLINLLPYSVYFPVMRWITKGG